jgi:uncharacterized LabA/DUF88 family protein
MKLGKAIFITIGCSAGCILIGSLLKQPLLKGVGKVAALGAIYTGAIVKLNVSDTERQKALREFKQENLYLQAQVSETQTQLNKLTKKIQTQDTGQRLQLSNIQKIQHRQKIFVATIGNIEHKLVNFEKTALSNLDNPKVLKLTSVKPHVQVTDSIIRVYIDGNNLNFAVDGLQIELDYEALRIELSQNASRTHFRYYTGVHSPMSDGQRRFIDYLKYQRYEVIGLPIVTRPDSNNFKTVGDDVKIAIDMIGEVKKDDNVILISGDGDFIPAIEKLQCLGIKVTVVAKKSMLSQQLSKIANEVIYLDDIQYKIAKY